jgi:hypothetical protein
MKQKSDFEQKLLKDIAEYLECGMICFVHKSTHELSYVPDDLEFHEETEVWVNYKRRLIKSGTASTGLKSWIPGKALESWRLSQIK